MDRERDIWSTSPAFRRQHLCSFEGDWNWNGQEVLCVPFVPWIRNSEMRLQCLLPPFGGQYKVRLRTAGVYLHHLQRRDTQFHLREQGYGEGEAECTRLLLIQPGELRGLQPAEADGFQIQNTGLSMLVVTVPEARRCVEAHTLVGHLVEIYEGRGSVAAKLEEWGPVRDACVASTVEVSNTGYVDSEGADEEGAGEEGFVCSAGM